MIGIARAPGTCGELVQGKIDGVNFLVTCPVEIYSEVTVKLNKTREVRVDLRLTKVRQAVEESLKILGQTGLGADVSVISAIPWGKGMASSSADIAAACAATAASLGTYFTPREIAEIALSIEPTDGVMYSGITLIDHVEGKVCRTLGPAPAMDAFIVDLGGTVDTLIFNASHDLDLLNKMKEPRVAMAVEKIEKGLRCGDVTLVGEAATESAFANQHILFKPELEKLNDICRKLGGVGINVGHSGTVVGLLFERGSYSGDKIMSVLEKEGFCDITMARIIDGGIEVLSEEAGDEIWQTLDTYMEETCGKLRRSTG